MTMKNLSLIIACILMLVCGANAQSKADELAVVRTVKMFYTDFDTGTFARAIEYSTEDWHHINPFGGVDADREAVLKDVRQVHSTFLKGVTDTPESFDVRFAAPTVAIVVVPSRLSTFTTPDGVKHEGQRNIRTFVVVKRTGQWRIMHDHNTFIASPPG